MNVSIYIHICTHTHVLYPTNNNQWNTQCIEDQNLSYLSTERKQEKIPLKCANNKTSLAMTQNPAKLKTCIRNFYIATTKGKISKQMTN